MQNHNPHKPDTPMFLLWNIDYAITRMSETPEELVNLRSFECGAVACLGGWCAKWPAFTQLGVFPGVIGEPNMPGGWRPRQVSKYLFGSTRMFESKSPRESRSHRQAAIDRLYAARATIRKRQAELAK